MPGRLVLAPVTSVPLVDGMDLVAETKSVTFSRETFHEKGSHYATG